MHGPHRRAYEALAPHLSPCYFVHKCNIRGASRARDRRKEEHMRVLIVEDEPNLGRQLRATLEGAGYAIDLATDGEDGHYLGSTESYDAVILDLGLPEVDGLTVLDRWRKEGRKMPVLVLTARDSWSDKVAGLDAGADDYLAKPFQTEELLARLRA